MRAGRRGWRVFGRWSRGGRGGGLRGRFVFYSSGGAGEFFCEGEIQVALFYFGDGEGVGGAGFGEGVAEELAFGGVEQWVGGEDFFEWGERTGCGHKDGAAGDSILLGMENVHYLAKCG